VQPARKIRLAEARDHRGILTLYNAFNSNRPIRLTRLQALIRQTRGKDFVFVAESARRIVGYLIVKIEVSVEAGGTRSEITDFYVDEQFRGLGIGRELLARGIALARRKKARYVYLFTSPNNTRAKHVYRAAGFHSKNRDTVVFSQGLVRGASPRSGP
jgi:ribosomal protein S18 acetylase RimI-like enzyme